MSGNDAVFSGPIPLLYDRYGEGLLFGPYAADIVRRLSGVTDGRLLETAAGTGIVTRGLAVALPPTVEIVATDLNQPMLDHAATKRDMGRVRFQQADAMALPFADASFDAVVCQFGIMFFPDRVAGMREARRVLKPGGRFVFSVWGRLADNPLLASVVSALAARYPSHPSWFLDRTPCGYHDPDKIRSDLRAAGFADATIDTVRLTGRAISAIGVATMFCEGSPMRAEIEALDPDGLDRAIEATARSVANQFAEGPFEVPLQAMVIETMA
jgi:SAM-dependent methyltransferase